MRKFGGLLILSVLLWASSAWATTYATPTTYNNQYGYNQTFIGIPVNYYYYSVAEYDFADQLARAFAKYGLQPPAVNSPLSESSLGEKNTEPGMADFKLVGTSSGSNELDQRVQTLFVRRCQACHKVGANKPGGITLFGQDGSLFRGMDRTRVNEAVQTENMPKGASPLTAAEKNLVNQWSKGK